jgi:hypothetical protein
LQLMAAKFHCFPLSPYEPLGELSFVGLIKASLSRSSSGSPSLLRL